MAEITNSPRKPTCSGSYAQNLISKQNANHWRLPQSLPVGRRVSDSDVSQVHDKTVLRCEVLCRIALRYMDVLSSTGFSLCTVDSPQLKPHRLKPVLLDPRGHCSRSTRLETSIEFMREMRAKVAFEDIQKLR